MQERRARILTQLRKVAKPGCRILDFGCGTGWLDESIAEYGEVVAIDLSGQAVLKAAARLPKVTFIAGNVFEHVFPSNSFDAVVSQEVLEHVDDQRKYLELASSYLVPGGHLILTTPNKPVAEIEQQARVKRYGPCALQPLENLVSSSDLASLLPPSLKLVDLRTICFSYGRHDGIYRIVNSWKIQTLANSLRLLPLFNSLRDQFKLGLHLFCVARKTE